MPKQYVILQNSTTKHTYISLRICLNYSYKIFLQQVKQQEYYFHARTNCFCRLIQTFFKVLKKKKKKKKKKQRRVSFEIFPNHHIFKYLSYNFIIINISICNEYVQNFKHNSILQRNVESLHVKIVVHINLHNQQNNYQSNNMPKQYVILQNSTTKHTYISLRICLNYSYKIFLQQVKQQEYYFHARTNCFCRLIQTLFCQVFSHLVFKNN
eukprot:TRINITY_DN14532_c0_g1_i1.p1 TRINITY_DN14532_c0_g1~~TRINITY_DN14532_c0_g1_i1.p1  ORF type:complete len:233 (+),score=-23.66 TRINITY_DN14532_c0_g1_i1:68-700(+)